MRFALTGLAIVFAVSQASAASIAVNGDFETGTFTNTSANYDQLPAASTALTGWTVISNSVAWGLNPTDGFSAAHGSGYVDLTGIGGETPYGGLQQTLTTVAGHVYTISLATSILAPATVAVSAGGSAVTLTPGSSFIVGTSTWTPMTGTFTATGASTVLSISGAGGAGSQLIGVDNVIVTDNSISATPVPSSWILLAMAFAALALWQVGGRVLRRA